MRRAVAIRPPPRDVCELCRRPARALALVLLHRRLRGWGPITGTAALPVDPIGGFANDRAARVPVLIGTNHDEATLFLATFWIILAG